MSASVLGVLACVAAALALSAAPALAAAEPCPNEQLREESNINPATHEPYSLGLPDCRAYEKVSPLEKQGLDAGVGGYNREVMEIAAAPGGETAGWLAAGAFSEPENFNLLLHPSNVYLSQRRGSQTGEVGGWSTYSAFAPEKLISKPFLYGLDGDSSPDLRSVRASCGLAPTVEGELGGEGVVCAGCVDPHPMAGGCPRDSWVSTPTYVTAEDQSMESNEAYDGGSFPKSGLSRVIVQPVAPLLRTDVGASSGSGLYEIGGVGTALPYLRLVSVDNSGRALVLPGEHPPLLGDFKRAGGKVWGNDYQAISQSAPKSETTLAENAPNAGEVIFFTASPAGSGVKGVNTLYARIHCKPGSSSSCMTDPPHCVHTTENELTCKEDPVGSTEWLEPGNNEYLETVDVSNPSPSQCTACKVVTNEKELKAATFVGASADGSKVFFTTKQTLLSKEKEESVGTTTNLYEYDFDNPPGEKLVLLSPDPVGANVGGVVRSSSDGSHVYFVATGASVLTTKRNANGEEAKAGAPNLYGYDTEKREIKFVAVANPGDEALEAEKPHYAQTTPDGRYLVFSAAAKLAGDTNGAVGQAVYRYDFDTEELTWVSQAAPGFTPAKEEERAYVAPLPSSITGAFANIDDWSRAISGESVAEAPGKTPEERHDGEYIIFTSTDILANHVSASLGQVVYEWHNGTVGVIGEGAGKVPLPSTAMSASGSDIFFSTKAQLVGQDTDPLRDIYDARAGGGFAKPATELPCPPDSQGGCQGKESLPSGFGPSASSLFTAGGNLTAAGGGSLGFQTSKPKPLTRAQLLAKALKACKGKPKKKRAVCEAQARKKYAGPLTRAQQLAKVLKACKGKPRKQRAVCESQARKKYAGKAKAKKSEWRGR